MIFRKIYGKGLECLETSQGKVYILDDVLINGSEHIKLSLRNSGKLEETIDFGLEILDMIISSALAKNPKRNMGE